MTNMYDKEYFSTDTGDKLTALVEQLNSKEASNTMKALNFYDGMQEDELIKFLDQYRKNWKKDEIIPRTRNIVRPIIEHSGPVIKDTPPIFSLYNKSEDKLPSDELTEQFIELINKSGQYEPWINIDELTRLLKTTLVLVQWNEVQSCMIFDLLHRGNAIVKHDPVTKKVLMLMYRLETSGDSSQYRLYVEDTIIDFEHNITNKSIVVLQEQDNEIGIVPVVPFYDTHAPRTGFWNNTPMDLVQFNEMNNLHMSESEFSMSWMKRPTLFTNCDLAEGGGDEEMESASPFPSNNYGNSDKVDFGPRAAVQLNSSGVESPFAEFKAPVVDLSPINESFAAWEKSFAGDWSVRVNPVGEGSANSGFQLIVEELPNMELRKLRQRNLASGFNRLYEVIKVVANSTGLYNFPELSKLYTSFGEVELPVDNKANEEAWTIKINEGRATLLDYFMQEKELSKEEALDKIVDVYKVRAMITELDAAIPATDTSDDENSDNNEEDEV